MLDDGSVIADHFTVLRKLDTPWGPTTWLALDTSHSERVELIEVPDESRLEELTAAVERYRGLVHPGIKRCYSVESHETGHIVVSQYHPDVRFLELETLELGAFWPLLSQVLDILEYSHGLGLCHGQLNRASINVSADNRVVLTGFGLPGLSDDRSGLSPQQLAGQANTIADDIFALGCLLHQVVTHRSPSDHPGSQSDFQTNSPIDAEILALLRNMLAEEPYKRPATISDIRQVLQGVLEQENLTSGVIDAPEFRRVQLDEVSGNTKTELSKDEKGLPVATALAWFGLIIIAGLALFIFLPESSVKPTVAEQETSIPAAPPASASTTATTPAEETGMAPAEIARLEVVKEQGKETARLLLRRQVELEDQSAQIWAAEAYHRVTDLATEGDQLYRDDNFNLALQKYKEGLDLLDQLEDQIPEEIERQLQRGKEAFENADPEAALTAFTILRSLVPDDDEIRAQLRRAVNLEEVLEFMTAGDTAENETRLDDALTAFQSASALDQKWQDATNSILRIEQKLRERRFRSAMSDGFQALNSNEFEEARNAFAAAQLILPASSEPTNGANQVVLAEQRALINGLREAAVSAEEQEDWASSIKHYESILAEDNTLLFAQQALKANRNKQKLNAAMTAILDHPLSLQDDQALAEAKRILYEASLTETSGPKQLRQIRSLSRVIKDARVPVSLLLESDGLTEVLIYSVNRLGRFEQTELTLVPGEYTIVGRRTGYRDVQEIVALQAGDAPIKIVIICKQRI